MSSDASVTALPEDEGQRIDAFLARRLAPLSRSRVQALLRDGQVGMQGGVVAEASTRVKAGEVFDVHVPPALPALPRGQDIPLDVLFEDEHLLVIVKPAGTVVHPAPGHADGTLVNALIAHCGDSLSGIGGVRRPGIVHRIDKEVSGVLVVAKNDRAHLGLASQFTLHTIERAYEAIVWGLPSPTAGRIERPIGRDPANRLRMAVSPSGKRAVTDYKLLAAAGIRAARMEMRLLTGRTHQIRVHLSAIGNPIVGDRLYAGRRPPALTPAARTLVEGLDRILLHARRLVFEHPIDARLMRFESPPPLLFDRVLEVLGA